VCNSHPSSLSLDVPDIFFCLCPGDHDLAVTALAFQTEIRSYPQNLPVFAAAGMLFFQGDDISYPDVHTSSPFLTSM
jgi:hypothetical protein